MFPYDHFRLHNGVVCFHLGLIDQVLLLLIKGVWLTHNEKRLKDKRDVRGSLSLRILH